MSINVASPIPFCLCALFSALPGTSVGQSPQHQYITSWGLDNVVLVADDFGVGLLIHATGRGATNVGELFHPDSMTALASRVKAMLQKETLGDATAIRGLAGAELRIALGADGPVLVLGNLTSGAIVTRPSTTELSTFCQTLETIVVRTMELWKGKDVAFRDKRGDIHVFADSAEAGPQPQFIPQPEYPPSLLAEDIEGLAWVRLVIGVNGKVERDLFRVLWASHPLFASSARAALFRGTFKPGSMDETPVRSLAVQAVAYYFRQ